MDKFAGKDGHTSAIGIVKPPAINGRAPARAAAGVLLPHLSRIKYVYLPRDSAGIIIAKPLERLSLQRPPSRRFPPQVVAAHVFVGSLSETVQRVSPFLTTVHATLAAFPYVHRDIKAPLI
jgi:hypothetical protein